jgi:flagellar basal-body rod modification protein FlgD
VPESISIPYVFGSQTNGAAQQTRQPTNNLDQDAFLKLLVAQLRYQNPMSPADPQSFLAQTAQFTTVEKLTQLTEQLAASDRMAQVATGSALVGRLVTYQLDDGTTKAGAVTSARPTEDGCVLAIGDDEIPLDAVTAVF